LLLRVAHQLIEAVPKFLAKVPCQGSLQKFRAKISRGVSPSSSYPKLTPTLQQPRNDAAKALRTENDLIAPQCRAIRSRL
jgi:hypothetical protein